MNPSAVWQAGFALLVVFFGLPLAAPASAAQTSLAIEWPAESARLIRDWRRAHGLPQAPEQVDVLDRPQAAARAIEKALTFPGIKASGAEQTRAVATHMDGFWYVSFRLPNAGSGDRMVVEIADKLTR
jgi:hypothetical protein